MSKRHPEWRHAEHRLTVTVYETDSSVDAITSNRHMTTGDAFFVRDAFAFSNGFIKWTPGGKGRRCTIIEVT
jgi:hypothetical protein